MQCDSNVIVLLLSSDRALWLIKEYVVEKKSNYNKGANYGRNGCGELFSSLPDVHAYFPPSQFEMYSVPVTVSDGAVAQDRGPLSVPVPVPAAPSNRDSHPLRVALRNMVAEKRARGHSVSVQY